MSRAVLNEQCFEYNLWEGLYVFYVFVLQKKVHLPPTSAFFLHSFEVVMSINTTAIAAIYIKCIHSVTFLDSNSKTTSAASVKQRELHEPI